MVGTSENRLCCKDMYSATTQYSAISYDMIDRTYDISISKNRVILVHYCPYCGRKLPKRLIPELFNVLENEFGIKHPDIWEFTNVPEEFKTDEWWRKRSL